MRNTQERKSNEVFDDEVGEQSESKSSIKGNNNIFKAKMQRQGSGASFPIPQQKGQQNESRVLRTRSGW